MSIREESKRASSQSAAAATESTVADRRVRIAIDFMKANLHRRISLSQLAAASSLSLSHLARLFKAHSGLSAGEYLRRLRMERARQLLETSLLSIKEIMAMAGYNNRSHFVRHFKRSPSEYRKRTPL